MSKEGYLKNSKTWDFREHTRRSFEEIVTRDGSNAYAVDVGRGSEDLQGKRATSEQSRRSENERQKREVVVTHRDSAPLKTAGNATSSAANASRRFAYPSYALRKKERRGEEERGKEEKRKVTSDSIEFSVNSFKERETSVRSNSVCSRFLIESRRTEALETVDGGSSVGKGMRSGSAKVNTELE